MNSKVDVQIWDGKGDFSLWRQKIKALLLQLKCAKAVDESWPENLPKNRKNDQDELAWSTIFLHLSDSMIRKVGETKTAAELWTALEK